MHKIEATDNPMRSKRRRVMVVFVIAATLSMVLAGSSFATSLTQPSNVVAALDRAKMPSDVVLAEQVPAWRTSVDIEAFRLLAATENSRYWVGADRDNNVCFLVRFEDGGEWASAMSCQHPGHVSDSGIGIRLELRGEGVEATLLPDFVLDQTNRKIIEDAGGNALGQNVAVFDLNIGPDIVLEHSGNKIRLGVLSAP